MFDKKQNEILLSVADNPDKSIWTHSKLTDTTYAHTHKIVKDFVNRGILRTYRGKDNRSKLLGLTSSGKLFIDPIKECIKQYKKQIKRN